ncbi:MAG: tetratricopeptide repeat protein [Acidobacteriota bacterium]
MKGLRLRGIRGLIAAALLGIGSVAGGQESASVVSAEEAADFARRSAMGALHGPPKIFFDSIDADGVLRRLLGREVWGGLTRRQQDILRATVREHFAEVLSPVFSASSEVRWAWVPQTSESPVFVSMGLHYGSAMLKTRWTVWRTPRGWTIEDIVLVDPGLSLAGEVGRLLGPRPLVRREGSREARARALPRLLGLLAVIAIALVFARRLPRQRWPLLWLTASVPAMLFLIDGTLAARRALNERYALVAALPQQPWREPEKVALQEQREGNREASRAAWEKAVEVGAPRGPVYYHMGLAARAAGENAEASRDFERALAEDPPAPGAGKELGLIALAEGRYADARARLETYLQTTGPDPDTLATLAVVEANLGDPARAVQAIESARALVGESWKKAELEAQIYARSGNAAATVAALRPLEVQNRLDRSDLRADPVYLPIATAPAWVAFLNEPPAPRPTPAAETMP